MSEPDLHALARTTTWRLHALMKRTDRATQQAVLASVGLALPQSRCLTAIGAFTPLSVGDLAAHANLDKAQASRAAGELVAKELVRKTPNPADARGVVLTLTPKGRRLHQRAMAVVVARNAALMACLEPAEQQQFSRLLDKLLAATAAPGADAP